MKKMVITLLLTICFHKNIFAQALEPIQTDRPDQTECPFIVPVKYLQVENGFAYLSIDKQNDIYSYPSTLIKYGISKQFDLRLIAGIINTQIEEERITGFSPLTIGFKVNLLKEKGIIPTTSFIGQLTFPKIASEKYKLTYYAPSFRFTMQHTLSKRISLGYNLGMMWDGETTAPVLIYTLTTGISLTEKINSYIEVNGFASKYETMQHNMDMGLSYFVTANILVDVSGGYGITENAPKYFVAVGLSFRVNTHRKK